MDEAEFLGRLPSPLWCQHPDTLSDDDGNAICLHCHGLITPPPVLTESLLWEAADAVWSKGYSGPGLPPSFVRRLK